MEIAWQKIHVEKYIKLIVIYNFDFEIIAMGCACKHFNAEISLYYIYTGTWGSVATSRTVPGSIPGSFTGYFSNIFLPTVPWPWSRLSPWWKWVKGTFPGGKGGRCVRLTNSPPSRAECHEIWDPKLPGTLWATPGLLRDCFTFTRWVIVVNATRREWTGIYCTVRSLGPKAGLDGYRNSWPPPEFDTPTTQPVASFCINWAVLSFNVRVHILDRQNDNFCVLANDADPHWADANCDEYDDARAKTKAVNSPWHCARWSRFSPRSVYVGFVVGQCSTGRVVLPTLNTC